MYIYVYINIYIICSKYIYLICVYIYTHTDVRVAIDEVFMGVYMCVKMLAYVHTWTCFLASVGRAQILVPEHHTEKEPRLP